MASFKLHINCRAASFGPPCSVAEDHEIARILRAAALVVELSNAEGRGLLLDNAGETVGEWVYNGAEDDTE